MSDRVHTNATFYVNWVLYAWMYVCVCIFNLPCRWQTWRCQIEGSPVWSHVPPDNQWQREQRRSEGRWRAVAVQAAYFQIYSGRKSLEDTAETHKSPALKKQVWIWVWLCVHIHALKNTSSLTKSQQGPPSWVELRHKLEERENWFSIKLIKHTPYTLQSIDAQVQWILTNQK